jgi:excisionase family DNA binding protein
MVTGKPDETAVLPIPDEWLGVLADAVAERLALRFEQPEPSPYATADEAADFLRCSRQHVWDLVSSRRLPAIHEGRRLLVRRSDLEALLQEDK